MSDDDRTGSPDAAGARIAATGAVPEDGSFLFRVADEDDEEREAILLRTGDDDEIHAWLNYCQHLTHIRLDKGSGAPIRNGEVVCSNHGAMFEIDDGRCTFGPCEGAYLNPVGIRVADGDVYLDDETFEFVGTGGIEDDELDLSSTSNVEF